MAQAPRTKTIPAETVADAPEWFQNLLPTVNDFMRDVTGALDGQLNRRENFDGQLTEGIRVDVGASLAADAAPFPLLLGLTMSAAPRSLKVVAAENLTDGSAFTAAVFPTWERATSGGKPVVKIRYLTGLSTSKSYRFSFELE